jgi:hypothetical protein
VSGENEEKVSKVQEVSREIRGAEGELREEGWYF